jgi:hypothetical protein
VTRAFGRIGDELMFVRRRSVPEYLRDIPGAIGIEDQKAVALLQQIALRAQQGFGRGAFQEGARG